MHYAVGDLYKTMKLTPEPSFLKRYACYELKAQEATISHREVSEGQLFERI
jgi:hypothetical protein